MADTTVNMVFKGEIAHLKKQLREASKLIKSLHKDQGKQAKIIDKHAKEQLRDQKKLHQLKQQMVKLEATNLKHSDKQRRNQKEQLTFMQKASRLAFGNGGGRGGSAFGRFTGFGPGGPVQRHGILGTANRTGGRVAMGAVGIAGALGAGLLGLATGSAISGYRRYVDYQQALAPSAGHGLGRLGKFRGGQLGFNSMDVAGMLPGVARATHANARNGRHILDTAMGTQRLTGMNEGETTNVFSTMMQGGAKFGTGGDRKALIDILAKGTAAGMDGSRMPEFFANVESLTKLAFQGNAGTVGTGSAAGILAFMNKFGSAGLQGSRGAEVLGTMHQTVAGAARGGGDEFQKSFLLRAAGFGMPGSNVSYTDALLKMEKGFLGGSRKENIGFMESVVDRAISEGGSGDGAGHYLSKNTGISLGQALAMIEARKKGGSMGKFVDEMDAKEGEEKDFMVRASKAWGSAGMKAMNHMVKLFEDSLNVGADLAEFIGALETAQNELVKSLIKEFKPDELAKHINDFAKSIPGYVTAMVTAIKDLIDAIDNLESSLPDWMRSGSSAAKSNIKELNKQLESQAGSWQPGSTGTAMLPLSVYQKNREDVFKNNKTLFQSGDFHVRGGKDPMREALRPKVEAWFAAKYKRVPYPGEVDQKLDEILPQVGKNLDISGVKWTPPKSRTGTGSPLGGPTLGGGGANSKSGTPTNVVTSSPKSGDTEQPPDPLPKRMPAPPPEGPGSVSN